MEKISQNKQTKRRKADAALSGRSFFRKKVQIRRNFATTCTQKGTQGAKLPADATFSGRSMVEMLGVLAIIGVLSVGAIAGYSKAMMKYKLNKQAEAMNMLLNNAIGHSPPLPKEGTLFFTNILVKLNLLPDSIKPYPYDDTYLRDIFNNSIWIFAHPTDYGMGYQFQRSGNEETMQKICHNILNVYKANASEITQVSFDKKNADEDTGDEIYTSLGTVYGNSYCTDNRKCLNSITLNDLETLCTQCSTDAIQCRIYVRWK